MTRPKGTTGTPTFHVRPTRALPRAEASRAAVNAIERAATLVTLVRDEGPDSIAAVLDRCDTQGLYALVTVLAAMVPDDRPVHELLAWTEHQVRNVHRRTA